MHEGAWQRSPQLTLGSIIHHRSLGEGKNRKDQAWIRGTDDSALASEAMNLQGAASDRLLQGGLRWEGP